jgi:hypothetical protein
LAGAMADERVVTKVVCLAALSVDAKVGQLVGKKAAHWADWMGRSWVVPMADSRGQMWADLMAAQTADLWAAEKVVQ